MMRDERRSDPEMAFQFPTQAAFEKRVKIARLGALFMIVTFLVPLLLVILR